MKVSYNLQIMKVKKEVLLKNTNSSIGETLGQSDGIIEEMETI